VYNRTPMLGKNLFIAPNATVVGGAEIGNGTSVWYGAVIRGDSTKVKIGENTSIG